MILGMAMVSNMFVAATAGTLVPLGLKALRSTRRWRRPCSSPRFTDVWGFASFLGLATMFLRIPVGQTHKMKAGRSVPLYSADALVLRTYKLGEADRIVVFLTRDRGKKRGVAQWARRLGTVRGAFEPLTEGGSPISKRNNANWSISITPNTCDRR